MTTESADRSARRRELALWVVALVAAVATLFGARAFLEARALSARAEADARYAPTPVVVARSDLVPGSELAREMLAVRPMPSSFLPAGIARPADAGALIGRRLAHAVRAGEPIQVPLLQPRVSQRLAQRVALGRRAFTLAVDETAAIAGMLAPGDRIDLRWGAGASLDNVPVIATGRQLTAATGEEQDGFATITLELAQADARRLADADLSDLRVLLRNPGDTNQTVIPGARPARRAENIALIVGGHGGPTPQFQTLQQELR